MLAALRSGSFVTRERMRVYSLLLLVAYVATIVVLLATARGIVDTAGRAVGPHLSNVFSARQAAVPGGPGPGLDPPAPPPQPESVSRRQDIPYHRWPVPP